MSLADNMNKIASRIKTDNDISIINDIYEEVLEDIKKESVKGNFTFILTTYDKTQKYKQIISNQNRRKILMTLLNNEGFTTRYVKYTDYWNDGKEEIVVKW